MWDIIKNLFVLIVSIILGVVLSYGIILLFTTTYNVLEWSVTAKSWLIVLFYLFSTSFHGKLLIERNDINVGEKETNNESEEKN